MFLIEHYNWIVFGSIVVVIADDAVFVSNLNKERLVSFLLELYLRWWRNHESWDSKLKTFVMSRKIQTVQIIWISVTNSNICNLSANGNEVIKTLKFKKLYNSMG